jgi:acyl-CoA dehydrogenase
LDRTAKLTSRDFPQTCSNPGKVTSASVAAKVIAQERNALLTPVAKAFSTDIANEAASIGVQVNGGMDFVEETGAAQFMRDARIAAIYERTNGIQAIDLVQRKVPLSGPGLAAPRLRPAR